MAATLTERRFTAPDWIFERKFDGIRLLAYKEGDEVRLFSRNRLPQHMPAIARAVGDLPLSDAILDGEVTWDRHGAYHVFDLLWADGRDLRTWTLEQRREALQALRFGAPLHHVEAIDRRRTLGARLPRGLGRRDRQASRIALRVAPLAAVAEDEMRAHGGFHRRRLYRSPGWSRRPRRAARWSPSRAASSYSPAKWGRGSTRRCCSSCAPDSIASRSQARRLHGPWACHGCVRTGFGRRSS